MTEHDQLPEPIKAILDTWNEDASPYQECDRIHTLLKTKGWGCSYGLDGVIYDVQELDRSK